MLNEMKVIFMDYFLEECILGVFRDKSFSLNDVPKRVKSQERVWYFLVLYFHIFLFYYSCYIAKELFGVMRKAFATFLCTHVA